MSSLDKLKIQGIRSFGPENPRVIEFFSPLTLILGQNGCGKTTIIESLKYVTTDMFPPGCGAGSSASFVHDPKIAKETCVRGQIRLRFRTPKGDIVTACKSVEVNQKLKKLEFKSLDATLDYIGPDGKRTSISNKCMDFKMEMPSLLGVSSAILENVIFCHQEESNWPLSEGQKVKTKFDAIFSATKYISCLDSIRKLMKEKMQIIRSKKDTLEALRANKETAARTRAQYEEAREEETNFTKRKDELTADCNSLKKRINDVLIKEDRILNIKGKIENKEDKLQNIKEMQRELRSKQSEKFDCTDADLQILIMDFDRNTRQQESKQKEIEVQFRKSTNEIENMKKEAMKASMSIGKLEAAQKTQKDNLTMRDELLHQILDKYHILGFEGHSNFDSDKARGILKSLDEFCMKKKEKLAKNKKEFDEREMVLQKEMDSLRSQETTLEHDISTLTRQISDNTKDSRILRKNLSDYEEELSTTSLEDLQNNLDNYVRLIEEEENRVNVPELTEEIESKRNERIKYEREAEDVRKKLSKMHRMAASRSQYESHIKDKKSLEERNKILTRKNEEDFESIFSGPIGNNIKNEFEAHFSNTRNQINTARELKSELEQRSTQAKMKIENEKREVKKLESVIKDFESELDNVCHGNDLEMAIDRVKDRIELLNKSKGDLESSSVMFKGFVEKIRNGEGCPLCHRDFDEDYPKEILMDDIDGKLKRLPNDLSKVKRDLLKEEILREKLLQLRPRKESADKAVKEITNRNSQVKKLQSDLEEISTKLEECSTKLDFLMTEEEMCNRVQADVITIDSNIKSIRIFNDKISNLQATLGTSESDLSMDELLKKQTDVEAKMKILLSDIDERQKIILSHNNDLKILNNKKIELSNRQLQLKKKQQETEKMKEEIEKLKVEKEKMEEKIEENRKEVAPIKFKLKEKEGNKRTLLLEKEAFTEQENKKLESIRDESRKANEIHRSVEKYIEDGRDEALAEAKRDLEALQEKSRLKEAEKKELQDEANRILKEITSQRERKRNMEDERTIREKENEVRTLAKDIEELKETFANSEYDKVRDEREELQKEQQRKYQKVLTLDGRLEELAKKARGLEETLNTKGIRDAEKKYKDMFIEIKCVEIACSDLNKYYKALDTAIMRFHQEKMNHINSIIRELWRSTYKGNDIDYIEIKTSETESKGADKRRKYDYRVVMLKNEVEMDMRGRCSAGQKVLASLIIRMALAETFSSNCGILALDEPTTNLDRENIEALSLALLSIVNKRTHQKNFQLIVITHDDEFLERMTRADSISYYYKVSRNEHGLSVINRYEVEKKE